MKLPKAEGDTSLDILIEALGEVVDKIHDEDKSSVVYPYLDQNQLPLKNRLIRSDQLGPKLSDVQRYFDRAGTRKYGGMMYCELLMGHTKPFEDIMQEIGYWFKENNYGLYHRTITTEKAYQVGWLMFSNSNMETKPLAAAIEKALGFPVDLVNKMIPIPGRKTGDIPPEQRITAIHVDIPQDKDTVINAARITELYSRRTPLPCFPLGIAMRMIPPRKQARSYAVLNKLEYARARQAIFSASQMYTNVVDILALDFRSSVINMTLREVIMAIPSDTDSASLFHSIDPSWRGGYDLSYSPDDEQKASIMASGGLIPYLIFFNQARFPEIKDILSNWFTPEAMRDAARCTWNDKTNTVENHADKTCTDLDDDPLVNHFNFEMPEDFLKSRGFDFQTVTPVPAAASPTKKKKWIKPTGAEGDNESLSTFQPNKKAKKAAPTSQPPTPTNPAGGGTTNPTGQPTPPTQGTTTTVPASETAPNGNNDDGEEWEDGSDDEDEGEEAETLPDKHSVLPKQAPDTIVTGEQEDDEDADEDDDLEYEDTVSPSQLETLQSNMDSIQTQVEDLRMEIVDDVSSLKTAVTGMEGKMDGLERIMEHKMEDMFMKLVTLLGKSSGAGEVPLGRPPGAEDK